MENRRQYTKEFKIEAVQLADSSEKSVYEIETDLGIPYGMIYKWRRQLGIAKKNGFSEFPGNGKPRDEELARLRKELAETREEREILRKALAIFSKTNR
jgi:transposase